MRPARLAVVAGIAFMGAAFAEETPSEQTRRATIVDVFEKNGCTMAEAEADALFNAAGLDQARDSGILMGMIADGTVRLSADRSTVRLVTGDTCEMMATETDAETDATRGRIVAAFEDADCVLSQRAFMQRFEAEAAAALPMIEAMVRAGDVRQGEGGTAILAIGDKCTARVATQKDTLIAALEENDCRLTEAEARERLSGTDLTMIEAEGIAGAMVEAGEAALEQGVTGEELVLKIGSACGT